MNATIFFVGYAALLHMLCLSLQRSFKLRFIIYNTNKKFYKDDK